MRTSWSAYINERKYKLQEFVALDFISNQMSFKKLYKGSALKHMADTQEFSKS